MRAPDHAFNNPGTATWFSSKYDEQTFRQIYTKSFYARTDERDSVFSSPFMSIDQKWFHFIQFVDRQNNVPAGKQPSFKIHKTNAIAYENDDT